VSDQTPAADETPVEETTAPEATGPEVTRAPEPETPAEAQVDAPADEPTAGVEADADPEPVTAPEEDAGEVTAAPADAGAAEPAAPAEPEAPAEAAAPAEAPAPVPAPPKPSAIPTPAALRGTHAPVAAAAPARSDSARFGRVADDGTVFVTEGDGERSVGSYPDASADDALQYYARKYDELYAEADLLHQRLESASVTAKDATESLTVLRERTTNPDVVGDLAALAAKVEEIEALVVQRREHEAAERAAAKEAAGIEREAIVAEAEQIAAVPVDKVQWKQSTERMRTLLEQWKAHQRDGARLDRPVENALWTRFAAARNSFDKSRRTHFAKLDETRGDAKRAKEALVREAELLATSKDWAPTARAFKQLMDRWRQAGRASRQDDDALWARFKTAQDSFFAAKDAVVAAEDESFRANLAVKEELLKEAEAILPISDLEAAKAALRSVQERWDKAGKVPRADIDRTEKAMRRVESAVRDAEDAKWKKSNPELAARANSLATQLEASVAGIRDDLARAQSTGNERKVRELTAKLEAQEAWLTQAKGSLEDHSGE
jgi:hypothetical protein